MAVTVGLVAHADYGEERPPHLGKYLRRWAATAEDNGLDALYTATEIGWDRADPVALLASLAAWTGRVSLGTAVLLAPLRDPLQVAESIATIQQISHRPVVIGLGQGWRRSEFDAVGVALSERRGRLLDHLETLPGLLRGEPVTHHGRHHAMQGVRVGWADTAGVPVWVGASSRPAIERAAVRADGWVAGPFSTVGGIARQSDAYREAAARADRRAGSIVVMRECWVAQDEGAAMREAQVIRDKYAEYARVAGPMPFEPDWDLARLAHDRFVIGDPATCAEKLADVVRRTSATDLVLRAQFRGSDPERALEVVEVLGREVRPRLHDLLEQHRG